LLLLLWSRLAVLLLVLLLLLVRSIVIAAHRHRLECLLLGCRLLVCLGLHRAERIYSGQARGSLVEILLLLWLSHRLRSVVELAEPTELGCVAARRGQGLVAICKDIIEVS